MKIYKKLKLNSSEINQIINELDGYVWVAVDARRGAISAGDEYLFDLRDDLLMHRSHLEDIYGLGVNLITGEIDYVDMINRRNPSIRNQSEIPEERSLRIETLMRYFFDQIPAYQAERRAPRYSRKPTDVNGNV